jgi:TatD DNase family protein
MEIVDTHAHLDMPEFDTDREQVITRAKSNGVSRIITIGIDLTSSIKAIGLAEKYPGVLAAIGIHPQDSRKVKKEDVYKLSELVNHPKVVAIGETGLDFYRNYSSREEQFSALQWQLEIAKNTRLPVIIHCRQAHEEIKPILKEWSTDSISKGQPVGVIHCFSGDADIAEKYLEMGFLISLGAYIGYPSSAGLREVIKDLPLTRLLIETDCPFLPPQTYRGKRNEPSYTLITLGILAEIKQVSIEEAALKTTQNAKKLFHISES